MTRPRALVVVAAAAAVLTAMNLSVWLAGASPARVLALMFAGTLGSSYGFAQSLAKATPLLWTGAAVALALRARLCLAASSSTCVPRLDQLLLARAPAQLPGPAPAPDPVGSTADSAAQAPAPAQWGQVD